MSQEEITKIRERAYSLCKEYLHGTWTTIKSSEIQVKKISGGLSNLLYLCSLPPDSHPSEAGEPTRVLLRLYGQIRGEAEEALEGLLTEAVIFTLLSESQRGPRLFGVFPGGRLEEYIPARPLRTKELSEPELSAKIAEKLAQIHGMRVPINKHPRWLWDTMQRWLDNINDLPVNLKPPGAAAMLATFRAYDLPAEMAWLKRELSELGSTVVFCHNDLQEGNILLREGPGYEVVVIDFEYSAYNYRGFDFANHMCEWVYDYTCTESPYFTENIDAYPTQAQQEHFVRHYLRALQPKTDYEVDPENMQTLLREIRAFTLASHFFWALWSVVNGAISTIPFDYWVYGDARFQSYFQQKSKLILQGELKE